MHHQAGVNGDIQNNTRQLKITEVPHNQNSIILQVMYKGRFSNQYLSIYLAIFSNYTTKIKSGHSKHFAPTCTTSAAL